MNILLSQEEKILKSKDFNIFENLDERILTVESNIKSITEDLDSKKWRKKILLGKYDTIEQLEELKDSIKSIKSNITTLERDIREKELKRQKLYTSNEYLEEQHSLIRSTNEKILMDFPEEKKREGIE